MLVSREAVLLLLPTSSINTCFHMMMLSKKSKKEDPAFIQEMDLFINSKAMPESSKKDNNRGLPDLNNRCSL